MHTHIHTYYIYCVECTTKSHIFRCKSDMLIKHPDRLLTIRYKIIGILRCRKWGIQWKFRKCPKIGVFACYGRNFLFFSRWKSGKLLLMACSRIENGANTLRYMFRMKLRESGTKRKSNIIKTRELLCKTILFSIT